jgi:hypothetical protein
MPSRPQQQERRGTRRILVWGSAVAVLVFAAVLLWPLLPGQEISAPGDYPPSRQTDATGSRTNQGAGESTAGKLQAGRPEDATGTMARDIQGTAHAPDLTTEQKEDIKSFFARNDGHRMDTVDFTIAVGSAVPRQVQLRELPKEVTAVMRGYSGDDYVLVRDQLIIVDGQARRIVAIIPGIG